MAFPRAALTPFGIAPHPLLPGDVPTSDLSFGLSRQSLLGVALGDGATTNRRIEWALPASANVAGSPLTLARGLFRVPLANPSASAFLYFIGGDVAASATQASNNAVMVLIDPTGAFRVRCNGTPGATNYRYRDVAGFRAAYQGQWVEWDVVLFVGVTAPILYINGAAVATVEVTGGVPPDWQHAALSSSIAHAGLNFSSAEFRPPSPINRALSAVEVGQMVQAGALVPGDRPGGSQVAQNNLAVVSTGNAWGSFSGATSTGFAATWDGVGGARTTETRPTFHLFIGQSVRVKFTLTLNSGVAPQVKLARWGVPDNSAAQNCAAGANDLSFVVTVGGLSAVQFHKLTGSGAVDFAISNIEVIVGGALLQPEITRTAQLLDHGPNRIRGVMFSGVRPLCDRDPVGIRGTSSATGFALGLGASDSLWFETGIITGLRIKQAAAVAQTITLRLNTSGGTVIATLATAASTDWQLVPLSIPGGFEVSAGDRLHWTQTGGAFDWDLTWTRR